jgi:arylsulfatase
METFAGYTAQTDLQVGRILDTLEAIGQSDNTLIFWEIGRGQPRGSAACS